MLPEQTVRGRLDFTLILFVFHSFQGSTRNSLYLVVAPTNGRKLGEMVFGVMACAAFPLCMGLHTHSCVILDITTQVVLSELSSFYLCKRAINAHIIYIVFDRLHRNIMGWMWTFQCSSVRWSKTPNGRMYRA